MRQTETGAKENYHRRKSKLPDTDSVKGTIFDIKKFALHDGPGIRTTIFLKGCPMRCPWCHNPESQNPEPEAMTATNLPGGNRPVVQEIVGRQVTVREVMWEIRKDLLFYDESGGGVTFSGGEPLMQPKFLTALLTASKRSGIRTALDTTGYAPWIELENILPLVDLFLYDLKFIDDSLHQKYTGVSNRLVFEIYFQAIDGRPTTKGGLFRVNLLPTTVHVYFGSVMGATPDGRKAGEPLSEGISPVQGADRHSPTAVLKSAAKIDHLRTGGTLLNQKFTPQLLANEHGIEKTARLIRTYFRMDGHHIQFNVVTAETLRKAQREPEKYRDLIVRVAGYSDYFVDLSPKLQEEIIRRTEHQIF